MNIKQSKKEIQRSRVKTYFIEAAIDIIKEEGLENLTTKKIGDKAGYSYATIYNYFENFNELVCICMSSIAIDCANFIKKNLKGNDIYEKSNSFIELIVKYNATNINIYYPFLSTKVDFSYFNNESSDHFLHPAYDLLLNVLKEYNNSELIADILTAIFNSALHFYIIHKNPKTIEELEHNLKTQINYVIKNILD